MEEENNNNILTEKECVPLTSNLNLEKLLYPNEASRKRKVSDVFKKIKQSPEKKEMIADLLLMQSTPVHPNSPVMRAILGKEGIHSLNSQILSRKSQLTIKNQSQASESQQKNINK
jgi:hypothetical protein